ncbi:MAG: PP0621 family protein [Castellaniella sp.]
MGKFLLWAVIILAVLLVSRILSHQKAAARQAAGRQDADARLAAESMVRCAHCHIFLPRSEAYMSQGKTWCSADHARLGLKK